MRIYRASLITPSVLGLCAAVSITPRLAPVEVVWSPCRSTGRHECATIRVPLDWADESKGMIPLALARLPAATSPREGFMFINPGGPGASGTSMILTEGQGLQSLLGRGWDIVSWDPRGISASGPNITLFSNDDQYNAFWAPLFGTGRLVAHGNLTTSSDVDFLMSQVSTFDNTVRSLNQKMIESNGDALKYVGTCSVVRDLVYLTDSLYGQGTDINFWGLSYGTVIATYLTQMFPDRVGRVILDGVFDPEKYANQSPMKWMEVDVYGIDLTLKSWTEACAGSTRCTFSARNDTSETLLKRINTILETGYRNYDGTLPWDPTVDTNINALSYDIILQTIRSDLYRAPKKDNLGPFLRAVESAQSDTPGTSFKYPFPTTPFPLDWIPYSPSGQFALSENILSHISLAILCGDIIDDSMTTTEDAFKETVRVSQSISRMFASLTPIHSPRAMCHLWTSRAVERLPQPMTIRPKNTILIMNTMADPITPYDSAHRLASSSFFGGNSRLVRLNSIGHSTCKYLCATS
ncbi:hypothetical protein FRC20_003902 [Serendipita sp. 405]|nr:hypothetical protein FRC20_003902 [Serendipita sp. 405]